MPNNKYLTIKEIGEILDVTRQAVQQWVVERRLKSSKVGRSYRILPEDLLEYLKGLGNSLGAMINFKKDIEDYLKQKQEAKK